MLKNFNLKLDETLIEKIKKESALRGLSQKDLVIKALEHFFTCKKTEETPTLKEIITKYKGKCFKCGRSIDIGEPVLWGRTSEGSILICEDCSINSIGDKTLIKWHQKLTKIKRLYKAYQNKIDALAKKFEEMEHIEDFDKIKEIVLEEHKFFMKFKEEMGLWGTKELEVKVEEMINILRKYITFINDFELFIEQTQRTKIKKKTRRSSYAY